MVVNYKIAPPDDILRFYFSNNNIMLFSDTKRLWVKKEPIKNNEENTKVEKE